MNRYSIPENEFLSKAADRSETVRKLREEDPEISQASMARKIGVSRERVRQILVKLELPAIGKVKRPHYCDSCSKPIWKGRFYQRKYCDNICKRAAHCVTIKCAGCLKLFPMRISDWNRTVRDQHRTISCSMKCRSITMGVMLKDIRSKKYWGGRTKQS